MYSPLNSRRLSNRLPISSIFTVRSFPLANRSVLRLGSITNSCLTTSRVAAFALTRRETIHSAKHEGET
jgi:hypothetical protein